MKDVYRDLFKAARLLTAAEQHLQKALDELGESQTEAAEEETGAVQLTLERVQEARLLLLVPESIKWVLPNY